MFSHRDEECELYNLEMQKNVGLDVGYHEKIAAYNEELLVGIDKADRLVPKPEEEADLGTIDNKQDLQMIE
jgi:hypothetical protein